MFSVFLLFLLFFQSNVLIDNDGKVKIADFGIAMYFKDQNIDEKDNDDNKKKDNQVKGSPYWMAPEVIKMENASPACDIWAVGATAIELFTGLPPYSNLAPMSALFRIAQDPHPQLPKDSSHLFKDFLIKCFCKDPIKRPSAKQLLNHKWLKSIAPSYDY